LAFWFQSYRLFSSFLRFCIIRKKKRENKFSVRASLENLFQTLNAYNSETRGARAILIADLESLFYHQNATYLVLATKVSFVEGATYLVRVTKLSFIEGAIKKTRDKWCILHYGGQIRLVTNNTKNSRRDKHDHDKKTRDKYVRDK
jgi:hypothetical protein